MIRIILSACVLIFPFSAIATAQSADPAAQTQSDAAKPASEAAPDSSGPGGNNAQAPAAGKDKPAGDKKKTKRVWTNEDMGSVKGTVSVVGDSSSAQPRGTNSRETSSSDEKNLDADGDSRTKVVANFRERLHQLRNQLESIDQKITELRNFKGEDTSAAGGINPHHGYSMVPIEDQIKQQEAKRKTVQSQIDDLEDEARKNGIEPGELR